MTRGERLNSITHLAGAALSVGALVWLVLLASFRGDPWRIVSFAIFGAALVVLYTASSAYHIARGRIKRLFQKLDHAAIYLLIAGTYTPFTLVTLRGPWGWTVFGICWGLAALGMVLDLTLSRGARWGSLVLYLVMGWLILIAIRPLVHHLPTAGLYWLGAGGVVYTLGVVFYVLDEKMRHAHGIWHLFVLGGSACHVVSVLGYVA
jgi:hemolysin III